MHKTAASSASTVATALCAWWDVTPNQSINQLRVTTPCQFWSRWTYPLPYYIVFVAGTLLYAV